MKAMKKLTAIVCAICISMIGAQAIAANGEDGRKEYTKKTGTATQTGTTTRTKIRTSR